jgi:two-component system alkaline phosphatase synthesis response regulator PhoP
MAETNKKKVLIVDDEPGVRQLVNRILSKSYAVLEAQDGAEAVDVTRSQKPDIILMDMMMPKVDGLTACYVLKKDEDTKQIPVVMITAVGYDLNKRLSQDIMGADGYVTKPFTPEDLQGTIEQFLSGNAKKTPTSEKTSEKKPSSEKKQPQKARSRRS